MSKNDLVVVTGAGGFIGGHLVARPAASAGIRRSAPSTSSRSTSGTRCTPTSRTCVGDLVAARAPARGRRQGRRRWSTTSPPTWAAWASSRTTRPLCMLSVLINTHMLMAAQRSRRRALLLRVVGLRLRRRQADRRPTSPPLKEEDAYPAMPEDGYGWEKLFSERMCRHFREDFGLADARRPLPQRLRPARHLGRRPREGAGRDLPQGRSRPSSRGKHEIEIWGDGEQTRSFMYIDDCVDGTPA